MFICASTPIEDAIAQEQQQQRQQRQQQRQQQQQQQQQRQQNNNNNNNNNLQPATQNPNSQPTMTKKTTSILICVGYFCNLGGQQLGLQTRQMLK